MDYASVFAYIIPRPETGDLVGFLRTQDLPTVHVHTLVAGVGIEPTISWL